MDNPVDDGHRHVIVVEEFAPVGDVLTGRQDDGAVLVKNLSRRVRRLLPVYSTYEKLPLPMVDIFSNEQRLVKMDLFRLWLSDASKLAGTATWYRPNKANGILAQLKYSKIRVGNGRFAS